MIEDELMGCVENTIERYDVKLKKHCINVAKYSELVMKELGEKEDDIYIAALMHDVGKVFINKDILDANRSLQPIERKIIDLHSYFGYQYLKELGFSEHICQMVLYHHGFNKQEVGQILVPDEATVRGANIIRICDMYDALTSDRSYRNAMSSAEAFRIIEKEDLPKDCIEALKHICLFEACVYGCGLRVVF